MELDQLKDFNEVVAYYKIMLEVTKEEIPTNINQLVFRFYDFFNRETEFRVICNNISLFISQVHERTSDIEEDRILETTFSNMDVLNRIESKKERMPLKERKRQIRNCLAHADYKVILDNIKYEERLSRYEPKFKYGIVRFEPYLEMENEYIRGKISYENILTLLRGYLDVHERLKHDNQVELLSSNEGIDNNFIEITPIELLMNFYGIIGYYESRIDDSEYIFSDDDKEVLREIDEELIMYKYLNPILYANNLLGMAYYMLNYTREINEQNERSFFNYYDIGNLEGISAKLVDDNGNEEESPIQINPTPKLQKELENVKTDLSNLRRRMQFKRRKLRKLENPEDRTPNKEETITSLKEELSNDEKKAEEYVSQRYRLECDIKECQENSYRDSSEFFRHLRNSLAHGNYTITYGDLNNLEEITYCFRDMDERTLKTYTVELTARQLSMILDAVQLKVNECDKGYLDSKANERKIMEVALRQCEVGMDEVNDEQLMEEEPMQEKGDEEIDEP